jgi:hypothetical protein
MSGTHQFSDGAGPDGEHPFVFRVSWGPDRLTDWLNPLSERFLWQEVEGDVLVGGLCDWTPCRGTLALEYGQARVRYRFDFEVEERLYRFEGEKKNLRPWNLARTHTTCYGRLVELESGREISTSVTRFKFRDVPGFLRSLRWA